MSATNSSERILFAKTKPMRPVNRLAQRVRRYFDQHPEVSREDFLIEAIRREIRFRERNNPSKEPGPVHRGSQQFYRSFKFRPRITAEDIRVHSWLNERLAMLDYERNGVRPRLRRLLFDNSLVRWLAPRIALRFGH
jgi:hypothetical protein